MSEAILVLNAGSSSVKFSLFPNNGEITRAELFCEGACEGIGHEIHFSARDAAGSVLVDEHLPKDSSYDNALGVILHWVRNSFFQHRLVAVGHRIVHGGATYKGPVQINDVVVAELTKLVPLAPLHQPHHLQAIAAISKVDSKLPQIACFDTSFHHTQPVVASSYALPAQLTEAGVRRYGFHGLSYEYIASVLPDVVGASTAAGRVVVAHLGAGASMCAMRAGQSVATTMGFTALDGLPMGRRCGDLDPGVVLYLIDQKRMTVAQVSDLLYHQCGLLGVSGISDDMRTLLASEDPKAALAVDLFTYRIGRELGSLAASLGGLDAVVFTAGIGEHATEIRRRVCADAAWTGLRLDEAANAAGTPCISKPDSTVSAWVIPTDEDLMIARHTQSVLSKGAAGG